MKTKKKILIILAFVLAVIVSFFLAVSVYHKIKLKKESAILAEVFTRRIKVSDYNMSVYVEGKGKNTIVFMSGSGTCSPVLDFKSLYSNLTDDFKIAVVEKFGYGFSDIADCSRDIDSMLEDTREALSKCGVEGPYILCPHSMSGLEALYWTQKFPEEVKAIIGLDMSFPEYYDQMKISKAKLKLLQKGAELGLTRMIPGISESEAIKHGTLTESEKEVYRALFYSKTMTKSMVNEALAVKGNAQKVRSGDFPKIPLLLFVSDGSGGTGFSTENWRSVQKSYAAKYSNAECIFLEGPHYIHDYFYDEIAIEIKDRFCGL